MAFWSELVEPDRQYRWYIEFTQPLVLPLRYGLKKASRPTAKISEVTHKYLNHFYYYPGRLEWEPISVSFASVKVSTGSVISTADKILFDTLKSSGYNFPLGPSKTVAGSGVNNLNTISKSKAVGQLTNSQNNTPIKLVNIDADGKTLNTWYLWNPFFTDMKYDTLEYASEEILNIDCTIKFDYATLNNDLLNGSLI